MTGGFFSGTPVSSTNKTDIHDITEILLKMALNAKTLSTTLIPHTHTSIYLKLIEIIFQKEEIYQLFE